MNRKMNKILLAIDASDQSMEAVKYVSKMFPPERSSVVIFHSINKVPEVFWDLEKCPEFYSKIVFAKAWESGQKKNIDVFTKKARDILLGAGFPKEMLEIKINDRKTGLARDILKESRQGYNAVVIGRTGTSKIKDIFLGSIAFKLIDKMGDIPLIIVGGKPEIKKIIVGFDNSVDANKGVDCLGYMIGDTGCEVELCYVIRPVHIFYDGYGPAFLPDDEIKWLEINKDKMLPKMENAKKVLNNYDIPLEKISTKIIQDSTSRAVALAEEAAGGDWGTIVVGRRGLSAVQDFFLGRVSRKIVNIASNQAIWIVG